MRLFKNKDTISDTDIICKGDIFKGNIESKTNVKIDGELIGDYIKAKKVEINKNGKIQCDIFTKIAVIDGILIGNIKQAERIIITSSGKLLGDINAKELITSEGVMIKGNFLISPNNNKDIETDIKKLLTVDLKTNDNLDSTTLKKNENQIKSSFP